MAITINATRTSVPRHAPTEPLIVRVLLILFVLAFITVLLVLPLVVVFNQALGSGWRGYIEAIKDPDSLSSIRLTLLTAAIAVPLNVVFGVAAAWAISKFE